MQRTIIGLLFLSLLFVPSLESSDFSETNFIFIGDTGKDNEGQRAVADAMVEFCTREKCDSGVLAGDIVYPKGLSSPTDTGLERVFDNYYNALNIPFIVALGNHDYGRLGINKKKASYQLLHQKKNPRFHLPHYWHYEETPHAVMAVIDTTRLMWNRDVKAQMYMLEKARQLATMKKKWFMVVGHHPFLSNGPHGNAGRYERWPIPFFVSGKYVKRFLLNHVCGKADFYLGGHDHSLQVFDGKIAGCNSHLIVSGAAAESTKITNRNVAKYAGLEIGFFHLSVSDTEVRVRAINQNNQTLYEENITKSSLELASTND